MSSQAPARVAPRPSRGSPGPAATPAAAIRKAALLLHGLQEGDRAWLLEQLPEAQRSALGTLLSELEDLGMTADPRFLEEVVSDALASTRGAHRDADPRPAATSAESADRADPMVVIGNASPDQLAVILRDEPPALFARLIGLHAWPWRAAVLAALGPVKAREVADAVARLGDPGVSGASSAGSGRAAPALAERLLATVSERLRRSDPNPGAGNVSNPSRGSWAGLRAGAAALRLGRRLP